MTTKIWEEKKVSSMMDMSRFKVEPNKTSERAELMKPFLRRLQSNTGKYKPMSTPRICQLMAYIDTEDLHAFNRTLELSPNYNAIWYWYVVAKDLN
jgi:hypothetical protein